MSAWMSGQGVAKRARTGRNRGRGSQHLANLLKVVDLLLDLADSSSQEGWKAIQATSKEHLYYDLKKALVVRWDKNRLLVSSSRKDPDLEDSELKATRHSETGSLEAIRQCLKATEPKIMTRKLILQGRRADTSEAHFAREVIRNALNNLDDLRLRKNTERHNPGNSAHWSFWIVFPVNYENRKRDCLAFIEKRWNKEFHRHEGEVAQQESSLLKCQELAETKQRLDSLDRWIQNNRNSWRQRFEARNEVRDRCIHVPLATAIQLSNADADSVGRSSVVRELRPEDIQSVVAQDGSQMLMIWEEGGAGKTSLAFEIARWGLDGKLAEHILLPILLDPSTEKGDLVERVQEQLSHVDRSIRVEDVRDLLSHRRLLVIVDHFSECTTAQRQWLIEHCRPQDIDLVLLTSRQHEGSYFGCWLISTIQPKRLQDEALFYFFENYIVERCRRTVNVQTAVPLLTPEDQMRARDLLERIVANKPITVLLVCMVIDKALDHVASGRSELLPSSVPELMLDYVERSFKLIASGSRCLADGTRVPDHWIADSLKLLALAAHRQDNEAYRPQNFGVDLALETLRPLCSEQGSPASEQQRRGLLVYLQHNLNLLQRKGGSDIKPIYRVALDPLADYLAALALMEECNGQPVTPASLEDRDHLQRVQQWLDLLDCRLNREPGDAGLSEAGPLMRGFLAACRDGYKELLARAPTTLEPVLRQRWDAITHDFARLAGIDPQQERRLEARHLIRRHTQDLYWSNPELLPKAIADISAYALEFAGAQELNQALVPLACTLEKETLPEPVRSAAAEALGLIGGEKAAKALVRMMENANKTDPAVRRAAAAALGLVAAPAHDPEAHWQLLGKILSNKANHLDGDSFEEMDAKLPLLQGAARGLQRLAACSGPFTLPVWGSGPGLKVPMLTLTTSAGAVTTEAVEVAVWRLPLPGGIPLEVVAIPEWEGLIGSGSGEEGREAYNHRPEVVKDQAEVQRPVRTPVFGMARFPLTQAQWNCLVDLDEELQSPAGEGRAIKRNPAQNRGPDLPVESVSWRDANQWCALFNRYLQKELGKKAPHVGLPSESLWEVSCRAEAGTPFHFGDTIDSRWANYNGNHVYPLGRRGGYLGRPSAVGSYGLVNAWGLADMHGNVFEWCSDVWHPALREGPSDGSSWEAPLADMPETRLLRGGCWLYAPHNCRSASRDWYLPDSFDDSLGFRVCVLP